MSDADQAFLEILPRARRQALIQFRGERDAHRREDLIQEVLAYCLKWTRLLWERGRDVRRFPSALATYAVLAVKSGRRLCGQLKSKDILSEYAQARFGFTCSPLPDHETLCWSPLQEALADNTRSPVDEQAAFRLDFPAWLHTFDARNRCVIEDLMLGERTLEVAERHRLSPGRVSQMRRQFHREWQVFCGADT